MVERAVTITNRNGIHARPAAEIVKLAGRYRSEITIGREDLEVNGKSIMGVMMLAAARGTRLELCTSGPEAEQALEHLDDLVRRRFDEDE
jgi:phosphocarrier protein